MPSVEILAVGTELLLGQLVDTNTAFIARHLAERGIDVHATHAVGDNRERIAAAIRGALERADGVITTGGLGPTVDDLTKEAVCEALGLDIELHEPSLKAMQEFFASIGREMRENNRKQAYVPRGSHVLPNPHGTAPGFIVESGNTFVASMPGVPREMKPMLLEHVLPWLTKHLDVRETILTRVIRTVNIAESEIDHRISDIFAVLENPKIAVLAHEGRCDVKVMAKAASREEAQALIAPIQNEIERRLDGHVFGHDNDTLESVIHTLLQKNGWRVAVAESCTGGRIAAALTTVPGSSKSFIGGIIAYDNDIKIAELGIAPDLLARAGAVSEETVLAMAEGVRTSLHADIALATTGIAGPGGATAGKPVGLVWFGLSAPVRQAEVKNSPKTQAISQVAVEKWEQLRHNKGSWRIEFRGDRTAIQSRATTYALGLLWNYLAHVRR
jgi:nicotinamide-nucleotide amidase